MSFPKTPMWTDHLIGPRRAAVFDMESPRFVLVFLPDRDGVTPRDNSVWTALLSQHRIACVCPDGGDAWWSARVCPTFDARQSAERYLLDAIVPWALARAGRPATALALAGIGMGGQGALRLGFKYPKQFRVVAALNAALDHHELHGTGLPLDEMYATREQCRQDTAALHVHPANWPATLWFACPPEDRWFRGNDRLHEKLSALGVPHAVDFSASGGGPTWDTHDRLAAKMMQVLIEGLEREGRRLL